MTTEAQRVGEAAKAISDKAGLRPDVVVILGTGLSQIAGSFGDGVSLDFSGIPGFSDPGVMGHKGSMLLAKAGGLNVAVLQGRIHAYEGHSASEVVRPLRSLARLGAGTLLVTNCAGALNPNYAVPSVMLVTDHINKTGLDPTTGREAAEFGPMFTDMSNCYDPAMLGLARKHARDSDLPVCEGVYAAVHGPALETSAERRMLHALGADAVGMSTVHEVIAARQSGMRVLGISAIANAAHGGLDQQTDTAESIIAATGRAQPAIGGILLGILADIG